MVWRCALVVGTVCSRFGHKSVPMRFNNGEQSKKQKQNVKREKAVAVIYMVLFLLYGGDGWQRGLVL